MSCDKCHLCGGLKNPGLMGSGPKDARVMVVGEFPGYSDDASGVPFSGKMGDLLASLLRSAKLKREDVYITNTVKCRPEGDLGPKDIKFCSDTHLHREISEVNPRFVILLGATALKGSLNRAGVMKLRGDTLEKDGVKYFVTLHPGIISRQPQQLTSMHSDFSRFGNLVQGKLSNISVLNWIMVNSMDTFRTCVRSLEDADVVAYDIETTSKDDLLLPKGRIHTIALAQDGKEWVIPVTYPGSIFYTESAQQQLFDILSGVLDGKKLVAHNGKYDNKWLRVKYQWDVPMTFDTMLASHLLDENRRHGLKVLSKQFFNAPNYEVKQPVDITKVPLMILAEYNAFDVHYTLKLYHLFRAELLEDKQLLRIYKNLTMPASKALEDIELEGVYIHPTRYLEALTINDAKVTELLDILNTHKKLDNWNSTQQIAKYLFTELKLPILEVTKTGQPSTSGETVLPRLKNHHPVIQDLLNYREHLKLGQFLRNWQKFLYNGKIHPLFKIHGTVTGRLSCKDPNLQQVPRDIFLRSLLVAPPGWVFFEADYSQVELRIAAMVSGDKTMIMAYQTGQDLHTKTAAKVAGVTMDKVTKDMRKKAKAVNFGFLYGMGWKKFKDYARDSYGVILTDKESQQYREAFFELYDGLPAWHERQRMLVRKFKYVRGPMGRKRRLPEVESPDRGIRSEAERQGINSPVQGFASDMALFAAIRVGKELPHSKIRVVGLVHDALLGVIREGSENEMLEAVGDIMTDTTILEKTFKMKMTVPIEIEAKIGPWGIGQVWNHSV